MRVSTAALLLGTIGSPTSAFTISSRRRIDAGSSGSRTALDAEHSRGDFVSSLGSVLLSTVALPSASHADEETTTTARSIVSCATDADDCISTANIKAKDLYSPPWTFEVSPDEAFARIKGVLKSDDNIVVTELDEEQRYIRSYAKRITADGDELEFLVKGDDKVVLFKSFAKKNGSPSDFGANRKRLETIRTRAGVFNVMGEGLTADSSVEMGLANGPFNQLKAFYGLQSGKGFESVFDEED
ncbi:hypothetical protein THAOC_37074 [Thalassiosira oceanica]|uniref:Uncharacterized protein n=1 Tax=Thalassiosira oceanica TaxID=159749 RepID=K0R6T8_THAOC|nr:hypothetical protein THAOC_37074 [Thalassiosira oceanica]|eukprot:EJK44386.1 hypothetical protein THAOC_37074 [Thalassiosira oceanica]